MTSDLNSSIDGLARAMRPRGVAGRFSSEQVDQISEISAQHGISPPVLCRRIAIRQKELAREADV